MNNQQRVDELAGKSGEVSIKQAPKYIVPAVRLHGNKGVFQRTDYADGVSNTIDIGNSIEGVMLKVRRSFGSFTKDEQFFTNEHNSWRDKVILFRRHKTSDGIAKTQTVDEGTTKELKEKYPALRMRQLIYFLLYPGKEVVKLTIKGKGLGDLFDYWQSFDNDEHMFQFVTKVGVKEEEGQMGTYYATSFERGEAVEGKDFDEVAESIDEVSSRVEASESFYAKPSKEEDAGLPVAEDDDVPVIEEEDDPRPVSDDPEINVNDIPF